MTIAEVSQSLVDALLTVPDLRAGFVTEMANPAPPVALVQPPTLAWAGYRDGPTSATFEVTVCVASDARAMERLHELVVLAANALEEVRDAAVTEARPGIFNDLPCYSITVETSL